MDNILCLLHPEQGSCHSSCCIIVEVAAGMAGQASTCPSLHLAESDTYFCMQAEVWSSSTQMCQQPQLGQQRLVKKLCNGLPSTLTACMRSGEGQWLKKQATCKHQQAGIFVMSIASSHGDCYRLLPHPCQRRSLESPTSWIT